MNSEKTLQKFRKNNLKKTPSRLIVLGLFEKAKAPVSAEDIVSILKKQKINRATIYRSLLSLERADLIRRVDLRKDAVFYEINKHHHHHIVCINCDEIEDIHINDEEKIVKSALKKSKKFFSIDDHSFELFGKCKSCIKK